MRLMCMFIYGLRDMIMQRQFREMTPVSFMFLELPRELQEHIYDKLEIDDRNALNQALPYSLQINKTIHTCKSMDRQLSAVWGVFKKKKPDPIPHRLFQFMYSNRDDPTIRRIAKDNDIRFDVKEKHELYDHVIQIELTDLIQRGNVAAFLRYLLYHVSSLSYKMIEAIGRVVGMHGSPAIFEAFRGLPQVEEHKDALFKRIIFNAVNYENTSLLVHMTTHTCCEVVKGLEYIRNPQISRIFAMSPEKVRLLLQYCDLSTDAKNAILEEAIDTFSVEVMMMLT